MKKQISAILSLLIAAGSLSLYPASAADELLFSDFETGTDGWTARGTATLAQLKGQSVSGDACLAVTGREQSWCGAAYSLDTSVFKPGTAYSFRASVLQQDTPLGLQFKMTLQYSTGAGGGFPFGGRNEEYAEIATGLGAAGLWCTLENPSFTIPADAVNPVLYVETIDSSADFCLDAVTVAAEGAVSGSFAEGDVDHSGAVNAQDAKALQAYLLGKSTENVYADTADLDGSGVLTASDLSLLKQLIKEPPKTTTTTTTTGTTGGTTVTTTTQTIQSGSHADPKEYMAKVRDSLTWDVPGNVKANDTGSIKKITYHSDKANRDKPANVWVPKGYSESQKYCVLYMNHGVMGNEDNMTAGWSITEMASYFIDSGEVPPFIIVFPQMYTDPAAATPGGFSFTMDTMDHYDDFFYDLTESLMPYIEQHYSVKTGRENTAIAGFSMGGRESLYCTISAPDKFGYCAASSPAPGIVPASDNFIANHLGSYIPGTNRRMTNADFKISDDQLPYLLMIAGGTNDSVVGTFPKEYHELFTTNGTEHIWREVPGAGHDNSVGTPLFYNFFRALFKA